MKKITVGLVGFGISAKVFHAPFISLLDEYELTHVLERNRSESSAHYPRIKIVRDIDELLEKDIDLVVITTPNETHFPYAQKALAAGKHVVVEKPFTVTSDEAAKLVQLAANSPHVLSVYQNRRYVSDFLTIKKVLENNLLGPVHEYIARYDRYRIEARPQAWREKVLPGSGILFDLGPHLIDQALTLFGHPNFVTADIRRQRSHAQVDDYFELWLDYGHMKVSLHAGMLAREMGPRYIIHGSHGSFVKYGEDPQEALLRAGELPVGESWGYEDPSIHGILHTVNNDKIIRESYPSEKGNYGAYYTNLYKAITEGTDIPEKPEHGFNTIKIIEAAFISHQEKKTIRLEGLL